MEINIIPFSVKLFLFFTIECIFCEIALDYGRFCRHPFYLLAFRLEKGNY